MYKRYVSNNVIRRIPRYLRKLEELQADGFTRISSAEFGKMLGLTPSQIRQDLSHFGEFGQQGYGYDIDHLSNELRKVVGMDQGYKAILVGVGNIGRALIDKFSFNEWGIHLECAFDIDRSIIGTECNGVQILHTNTLENYLLRNPIDIAVLCVPSGEAIQMARRLTENGIEAIWNFTNVEIVEPYSHILVENIHFSDSLLNLSYYLTEQRGSK